MQNRTTASTSVRHRALKGQRVASPTRRARESRSLSKTLSATKENIASTSTKDQPENVANKQHYTGKKALVVGAGPAGIVTSSFLVQQGFQVDVYEQRKDPTKTVVAPTHSVSTALNRATVKTLKEANIDIPISNEECLNGMHQFFGSYFLTPTGEILPSTSNFKGWLLVETNDFATNVMDVVRSEHQERITFHFEHLCTSVDLSKQEVQFQDHNNNTVKRNYDLLIGADGADSQVRQTMEEHIENFRVSTTLSTHFYVSCPNIVVKKDEVPDEYKKMIQPGVTTFFVNIPNFGIVEKGRRMVFSCLTYGNLGVNIDGTKFWLETVKVNVKEYLSGLLPEDFPQNWIDQIVSQLKANPLCRRSSITEVSALVGPRVVLIGDAGHALAADMAFGCNMTMQDGLALNDALECAEGEINLALKTFNNNRYKEVREFQLLEKIYRAKFMKHEGINKLLPVLSDIHYRFHALGDRYFPSLIPKTAISRCFLEEISSGEATRSLQVEFAILLALVASVLCLTFAVVTRLS